MAHPFLYEVMYTDPSLRSGWHCYLIALAYYDMHTSFKMKQSMLFFSFQSNSCHLATKALTYWYTSKNGWQDSCNLAYTAATKKVSDTPALSEVNYLMSRQIVSSDKSWRKILNCWRRIGAMLMKSLEEIVKAIFYFAFTILFFAFVNGDTSVCSFGKFLVGTYSVHII